jgi:hypothetical protein
MSEVAGSLKALASTAIRSSSQAYTLERCMVAQIHREILNRCAVFQVFNKAGPGWQAGTLSDLVGMACAANRVDPLKRR